MAEFSYASVMAELQRKIQRDYVRLVEIARDGDPQRAGHGGERTWVKLLRNWLPASYKVRTRRYILPEDGTEPHEWDIVVFRPSCPPRMRQSEVVLAGGVAAAFSVKTTLRKGLLAEEVAKAVDLRRRMRARTDGLDGEILPLFPCGILTHSHAWATTHAPGSPDAPSSRVSRLLVELQDELVEHPRELLDFVCVADLAAWMTTRVTHIPEAVLPSDSPFRGCVSGQEPWAAVTALLCTAEMPYPEDAVLGVQFGPSPELDSPVGAFVAALLVRLSYADPSLAPIAGSLQVNGSLGLMHGVARGWSMGQVYSPETTSRLQHLDMKVFH